LASAGPPPLLEARSPPNRRSAAPSRSFFSLSFISSPCALQSPRGPQPTARTHVADPRFGVHGGRRHLLLRRQAPFSTRPAARRHRPSRAERDFLFPVGFLPGYQRVHQSDPLDHQPIPPLSFTAAAANLTSADAPRNLWQTTCSKIAISRSPSVLPSRNFRPGGL
jgi:hypothetical protein